MSKDETMNDLQLPREGGADLVEVCRCRDCRYWRKDTDYTCRYHGGATTWMPKNFCSYGERRQNV